MQILQALELLAVVARFKAADCNATSYLIACSVIGESLVQIKILLIPVLLSKPSNWAGAPLTSTSQAFVRLAKAQ